MWRKFIYPIFPYVQKTLLWLHIIHHSKRQPWLIGNLKRGRSIPDFIKYLHAQGFWNHFVAWHDPDQIASLRHLTDFREQYHLRIFKDGEVRGHYEETPEAHPIAHFAEKGMQARRERFLEFVGNWVNPARDYSTAPQGLHGHRVRHAKT